MSKIIMGNGKVVTLNGNLSMRDGKWFVNGKEVNLRDLASETKEDEKNVYITINIEGMVEHLDVESCTTITINGECRRVKTNMGDIRITGNVDGDVHTNMGDIDCGRVSGDVHTNMGNVRYVKQ